jgi:5-methylcytosine-specific restriction protein A
MRNPAWVRDEIILAMDLYFRADRKQLPANHPEVLRLSELLNALPIHGPSVRDDTFRNPPGISMILGNFLGIDPDHNQPGLSRNNRLQEDVWRDFVDRVPALRETARAIEHCVSENMASFPSEEPLAEDAFKEGWLLTRLHNIRERNQVVIEKKKACVLAECGRLECEVCGFDFEVAYGVLGRGFSECHHTVPLAGAAFVRVTRLSDLAIICANCHRMIHRSCPAMSVEQLREAVAARRVPSEKKTCESYGITNLSGQ